jgi:predicted transcriptional regulator
MVPKMARKQVLVQLDDAQIAGLDRLAVAAEDSRSAVIRAAVALYLDAIAEGLEDLRYAEAYRLVPEDLAELEGLRSLGLTAWPRR